MYTFLAGYEALDFTVDAQCPLSLTYTNAVSANTWIDNNSGVGKLVQWFETDNSLAALYTVEITASNTCASTTASYNLDVIPHPCPDALSIDPPILTDQEYTITTAAKSYLFDEFIADPPACTPYVVYTFSDTTGSSIV